MEAERERDREREEGKGSNGMRIWDSNWVSNCGSESVELTLPYRALSMGSQSLAVPPPLPCSPTKWQVAIDNANVAPWKWNLKQSIGVVYVHFMGQLQCDLYKEIQYIYRNFLNFCNLHGKFCKSFSNIFVSFFGFNCAVVSSYFPMRIFEMFQLKLACKYYK